MFFVLKKTAGTKLQLQLLPRFFLQQGDAKPIRHYYSAMLELIQHDLGKRLDDRWKRGLIALAITQG